MALTQTEKIKIVTLLGYPAGAVVDGNTNYLGSVARAFNDLPAEIEPDVKSLMTKIASIDGAILNAATNSNVKKVDDIEFFEGGVGSAQDKMRKERMSLISQLAAILGIPVCRGSGSGMKDICIV